MKKLCGPSSRSAPSESWGLTVDLWVANWGKMFDFLIQFATCPLFSSKDVFNLCHASSPGISLCVSKLSKRLLTFARCREAMCFATMQSWSFNSVFFKSPFKIRHQPICPLIVIFTWDVPSNFYSDRWHAIMLILRTQKLWSYHKEKGK